VESRIWSTLSTTFLKVSKPFMFPPGLRVAADALGRLGSEMETHPDILDLQTLKWQKSKPMNSNQSAHARVREGIEG
jgi:hypothetical protein